MIQMIILIHDNNDNNDNHHHNHDTHIHTTTNNTDNTNDDKHNHDKHWQREPSGRGRPVRSGAGSGGSFPYGFRA